MLAQRPARSTEVCDIRNRGPDEFLEYFFTPTSYLHPRNMHPILIIGAGQAGLSTAYHLQRRQLACTLIDAHARVGDGWRKRWDSLRLFSPARYSSLPGWPMPYEPMHLASKDEVADYLEHYAAQWSLEMRLGTRVEAIVRVPDGFELTLRQGDVVSTARASRVVIAAGTFATPYVPQLQGEADEKLFQIHVSRYQNPAQLPDGPALVVGTGASGTQIATELAATRKVYLSGPETKHLPRGLLGKDIYWWLYATGAMGIRRESWLGQRLLRGGGADLLIGKSLQQLVQEAGLIRQGMLTAFVDGMPTFDDGHTVDDITSVVWATGYRNDYTWLQMPVCDAQGQPRQVRGVAIDVPGLYFVGLRFMHRADSSNMSGVSRDAEYIAAQIAQ
jgi:putative flavoprotein involved in K+ transport